MFGEVIFLACTSFLIPHLVKPCSIMGMLCRLHSGMITIHIFVTEVVFTNTHAGNRKLCW